MKGSSRQLASKGDSDGCGWMEMEASGARSGPPKPWAWVTLQEGRAQVQEKKNFEPLGTSAFHGLAEVDEGGSKAA